MFITIAICCHCYGPWLWLSFEVMNANLCTTPEPRCELRRGETVSVDGDRRGQKLRCIDGHLWITQAGDAMDHLVAGGREFVITRPGRVVIQALTQRACVDAVAA